MSETLQSVQPLAPATNLRDRIEDALAAAIVSGEMPPGRVYSAPTLSQRFGVSVTPVREALLNLEKRGFVEAMRNKGFRVTEVSEVDLKDIVDVRLLLEPPSMAAVADAFPQERLEEFRELAEAIVQGAADGDLARYLAADTAFHTALLGVTGNGRLVETVAHLRAQTRLVGLADLLHTPELTASAREHSELLDLLAAGRGADAERLMRRHIQHVLGWWQGRPEA